MCQSHSPISGEDIDMNDIHDPYLISNILMTYLRNLNEPIMTYELYDIFLASVYLPDPAKRMECLHRSIVLLYPGSYHLLKEFCGFLKKLHDNSNVNKTNANTLAIVLSSIFLRTRYNDQWEKTMGNDIDVIDQFVVQLIVDYDVIFLGKEVVNGEKDQPK